MKTSVPSSAPPRVVSDDELAEDYIVPSVFNRDVSAAVASAVADKASREPVASPAK
jgi:malic enzyme